MPPPSFLLKEKENKMCPISDIFNTDSPLSSPIRVNPESSLPPILFSPLRSPNPSHAPMSPMLPPLDHLPSSPSDTTTATDSMYLSSAPPAAAAKPHRQIDFYKDPAPRDMMIELSPNSADPLHHHHHHDSSGEDHEVRAPKKRAETWVQEETRSLIGFRREMDGLFNTSKSNKHLWEQISAKMRDKGFDRSPTMCTDKWRNLLKEFKKTKHQCKGSALAKMSYYKELDELLKERNKNTPPNKSPSAASASKVGSYMQFSEKGMEDAGISFGSVEATHRSTVNMERHLDLDGQHLAITAADAIGSNGVPPWNWRDTSANGSDNHTSFGGRVIIIKWGEYTKKVGIDGTAESIKEAIKSAFGLRTRRAFWLEDEAGVVRSLDRDMPLGTYTLHLDEGVTIKVCICEDADRMTLRTEDKTFYTEEDFPDFLTRRGWTGLREFSGFRTINCLDDLRPGVMYQGIRL